MKPKDTALAILVAIIWGSNFVVIDAGLADIPPLLFTAMRFVLVALPAVFLVRPPGIGWRNVVLIGVFMSVGQFSLVYLALHLGMPPGLTSLVLQAQVLLTVLLSSAFLGEKPSRKQLLGVGVGVIGMIIVAVGHSAIAPILPLILVLGAALSWSIGNVLARKVRARSGLSLVVWSGLVVPVPLLLLSLVVEGTPRHRQRPGAPIPDGHRQHHVHGIHLFAAGLRDLEHPAGQVPREPRNAFRPAGPSRRTPRGMDRPGRDPYPRRGRRRRTAPGRSRDHHPSPQDTACIT